MEKKRITYGVFGMMEYQAVIKLGSKNTMKVNFTDGSLTAMGTNPAKYSTDNFMVQHAIENSGDFKRGLIKKLGEVKLDGEVKIERNASKIEEKPTEPPVQVEPNGQQQAKEDTGVDNVLPKTGQEPQLIEVIDEDDCQAYGRTEYLQTVKGTDGKIQVTVHCNDDAKDYLADKFGCVRSKLKNRNDILEAGAANGVEFVFE